MHGLVHLLQDDHVASAHTAPGNVSHLAVIFKRPDITLQYEVVADDRALVLTVELDLILVT